MPEIARLNTLVAQLIDLRKEDREEEQRFRKDMRDAVGEIRQEAQRTTARINSHEIELSRLSIRLEALQKEHLELAVRGLKQDEALQKELARVNQDIREELAKIDLALRVIQSQHAGVRGGIKVAGWLWQAIIVILSGSIGAAIWAALGR